MEYFDIVDINGDPTGDIISREEAHNKGIRHRTAHIWIVRNNNYQIDVLLQKRALNKDSHPGCYDTSSAGHIQAGDEVIDSALRELGEELGINATKDDLKYIDKFHIEYKKEFHNKLFCDNEVAFVHIYDKVIDDTKLVIQKEELESVKWFPLEYVYQQCSNHNKEFCVPIKSLEIIRNYFNLDKTNKKL